MPLTGQVHIYRPSDETLDLFIPVTPDTAMVQKIPLAKMKHGKYIVKVEWQSGKTGFYKEQEVFIP